MNTQNIPTDVGLSDLLIWFLNHVVNHADVVNDVNVNNAYDFTVNDVNDVSNVNTVTDKNRLLTNQFPNIKYREDVKLIKNILSKKFGHFKWRISEASIVYVHVFIYVYVVYVSFLLFMLGKRLCSEKFCC